jgi:hypothetical protein
MPQASGVSTSPTPLIRVYSKMAQKLGWPTPPANAGKSDEMTPALSSWLSAIDRATSAFDLRRYFQNNTFDVEADLHPILEHYLAKQDKNDADRDKIDLLLSYYFVGSLPLRSRDRDPDIAEVLDVLKPVLGDCECNCNKPVDAIHALVNDVSRCTRLSDLQRRKVLERGRELKQAFEHSFFCPATLAAFTRFNFTLNRAFVRLRKADLQAINEGLTALTNAGVLTLDCRSAGLGEDETLEKVRSTVQTWIKGQTNDYRSDRSFEKVIALRKMVDHALRPPQIKVDRNQLAAVIESLHRLRSDLEQASAKLDQLLAESKEEDNTD